MPDSNESPPRHASLDIESKPTELEQIHDKAQKRKASSPPHAEQQSAVSPKRNKVDNHATEKNASSRSLPAPKDRSADRRQSASQEERNRGRRLYGGLLNTLSGTTTNSHQKRRQEIERRQQAKVSQQQVENDKHRQEKLAKLNTARKVEQIKFDEQVMYTKHSNMLATARFLHTRANPKIYYLPWNPTEKQKDIIEEQIQDAEDTIDREASDFKRRKEQRLRALGVTVEPPMSEPKEAPSKAVVDDRPTDISQSDSTNHAPSQPDKVGHERESDETGDVMVEEAEDTVIY